jgi:hypothetical protein
LVSESFKVSYLPQNRGKRQAKKGERIRNLLLGRRLVRRRRGGSKIYLVSLK